MLVTFGRNSGVSRMPHSGGTSDAFCAAPIAVSVFVRNKFLSRAIGAFAQLIAVACAPMHADPSPLPRSAVVYFVNGSLDQAAVYVISSGKMRTRIGTVMAGQTQALSIPDVIMGAGDVTVVARLLAHPGYISSGPLNLSAGDQYSVRLVTDVDPSLSILPASKQDILAAARHRP